MSGTFYALVQDQRVLGFRDNVGEHSLGEAERTALVFGIGTEIYEIEGALPSQPDSIIGQVQEAIEGQRPVAWIGVDENDLPQASSELEEVEEEYASADQTGVFRSIRAPSESGMYRSVAAG
jgi:hypothetical protein